MDAPQPMILGHLDVPNGASPVAGMPIVVQGWAVGTTSSVSRVEVLLNGHLQGSARLGRVRPDVAASLQDEDAELSGFEFTLDARRLAPLGERAALTARAILLDGTCEPLPPGEIAITLSDARAAPSLVEADNQVDRRPRPRQPGRGRTRLLCFGRSLDHGGSQLRMKELMQSLHATGEFEITVVSPTDGPLRGELETAGAAVHIMPDPLEDIAAYRKQLAQTAAWATGRFDLVLAFTLTSFFGVDVANELNVPSVWRIGETETLATVVHWLGGRLDPAVGLRAHLAFETASAVLFVSRSTLQLHRPAGSAGRFAVLRNGVDLAGARAYIRTIDRDVCRRSLGIESEQRLLVCAGTVWPIKGQALLLAALKHICQVHLHLACVLIGQHVEPYAGALSRLIERGGFPASVRMLPFCDDLRPWWRAADAAVCPSESEALPTSILEAMAFGLPVLASRVGGIPEIVEDRGTGWLCEPNDLGSLIAGLTRVAAAEPSELRTFGERGQERVAQSHDRFDLLSRMTDLLKQVSRGSSPLWLSAASHRS